MQSATDNVNLIVQLRNSTPASITDTHRNNRLFARIDSAEAEGNTANLGSTSGWAIVSTAGNAANELNTGIIEIAPNSGQWTHIMYRAFVTNTTTQRYSLVGAGACEGTTAPAGVKIYMSSGNIARGAFQLYGITK